MRKGTCTVVAMAVLAAPPVAGAAITHHDTPAGDAVARAALLRRGDVGKGWGSAPGPRKVPPLACPRFSPPVHGVTEEGDAVSPTFRQSSSGPFLTQDAYVYGTAAQRATVWRALARPRYLRCVAASVTGGSGHGVRFAVTGKRLLSLPRLGVAAAGYRVRGTATTQGVSTDVFLDVLLLGSGRTITAISLSTFEQPVARALELRLARTAAGRL